MWKRAAFALVLAALALAGAAQEKKKPAAAPAPPAPKMQAMMEMYRKAAAPGEPHKHLAKMVGTWNVSVKAWMGPGEPSLSQGTAVFTSLLGGRFVEQRYTSTFMDQPFEGLGLAGYDNVQKKFVSLWIDNMGTGFFTEEGQLGPDGTTLTTASTYNDPATGKAKHGRSVTRWQDDAHFTVEMYDTAPDGKEVKAMELAYAKRGGKPGRK